MVASGTPFEKGPESLMGAMSLLMYPYKWHKSDFWRRYTPEKLGQLQTALQAYLRVDCATEEANVEDDDNPLTTTSPGNQEVREWNTLLVNLMIQRGRGCMQGDQHIMPLPRLRYRTVGVENTSNIDAVAQQVYHSTSTQDASTIQQSGNIRLKPAVYTLCRACATFPKLAMAKYREWEVPMNPKVKGGKMKTVNLTTVEGLKAAGLWKLDNMMDPEKNPFLADLDTIVGFSAKIALLSHVSLRSSVLTIRGHRVRRSSSRTAMPRR
jgi:hypothetical protein